MPDIGHALPPLALRRPQGPSPWPWAHHTGTKQWVHPHPPHPPFLRFWEEKENHKPGITSGAQVPEGAARTLAITATNMDAGSEQLKCSVGQSYRQKRAPPRAAKFLENRGFWGQFSFTPLVGPGCPVWQQRHGSCNQQWGYLRATPLLGPDYCSSYSFVCHCNLRSHSS